MIRALPSAVTVGINNDLPFFFNFSTTHLYLTLFSQHRWTAICTQETFTNVERSVCIFAAFLAVNGGSDSERYARVNAYQDIRQEVLVEHLHFTAEDNVCVLDDTGGRDTAI